MATKTIEAELLELEQRYWQAIQDRDVKAAMALTDFPCIVAGRKGVGSIDPKTYEGIMKSATYTLRRFEIRDGAQVRLFNDDVAVVAYQVHEDLTVDGSRDTPRGRHERVVAATAGGAARRTRSRSPGIRSGGTGRGSDARSEESGKSSAGVGTIPSATTMSFSPGARSSW